MPAVDAIIFNKRGVRKSLKLVLDDGDEVFSCIKQAMKEHTISEVKVEEMNGTFKEGELNYFEGNRYKLANLSGKVSFRASGLFKLSYDELYGSMHVSINERHPLTGTLVKARGTEGFEVKLSFVEFHEK